MSRRNLIDHFLKHERSQPMTLQEFIDALKKTSYSWKISPYGVLRTSEKPYACPICAVANHILELTGEDQFYASVNHANIHLKLPDKLKNQILFAADGHSQHKTTQAIRKLLIQATNPTKV